MIEILIEILITLGIFFGIVIVLAPFVLLIFIYIGFLVKKFDDWWDL